MEQVFILLVIIKVFWNWMHLTQILFSSFFSILRILNTRLSNIWAMSYYKLGFHLAFYLCFQKKFFSNISQQIYLNRIEIIWDYIWNVNIIFTYMKNECSHVTSEVVCSYSEINSPCHCHKRLSKIGCVRIFQRYRI